MPDTGGGVTLSIAKAAPVIDGRQERLESIAANLPALVYQFVLGNDGNPAFPFLSDACPMLLGISAAQLQTDPGLFARLMEPEDRASYLDSMHVSAETLQPWNWEGRIRIPSWNDTKWINLRARPRILPGIGVQWDGLMTNITFGKQAELEMRESRRQLAELSAHVETVKEKERERIAREIHDDLGGNLTAIKMALSQLRRRLPNDQELLERAEYVESLVDGTIEATHRIASDLRPSILDLGIVDAIAWQAREFGRQSGIVCELDCSHEFIDLPREQATGLFRIFQESLNNIAKHSGATRVTVALSCVDDNVLLHVVDNGHGFVPADRSKPGRFGIAGMSERAAALGGELEVSPDVHGGCRVAACLPRGAEPMSPPLTRIAQ